MNRALAIFFSITLLLAPLCGAAQPEADRPGVALVDRIASIRLELNRMDKAIVALGQQRDSMSSRLDQLAGEIAALKARRAQNPLLPEITLTQKLRQSQDLSATLTVLNRELESLTRIQRDKLQSLVLVYDGLVDQTLKLTRTAEGERRRDLMRLLAQARRERESIRDQLLPRRRSLQSFRPEQMLASDDPDELGERADAIRDQKDRLQKELALLDRRIAELKSERRLDREMRDFITDQDIFDEGSRIMVVPRNVNPDSVAATDGSRNKDESAEPPEGGDPSGPDGYWGGTDNDAQAGAVGLGSLGSADANPTPPVDSAGDARQPLGVDKGDSAEGRLQHESNLSGLKRARSKLVDELGQLDTLLKRVEKKIETLSER